MNQPRPRLPASNGLLRAFLARDDNRRPLRALPSEPIPILARPPGAGFLCVMWRSLLFVLTIAAVCRAAEPNSTASPNRAGLNALEEKFRHSLSNAVFNGRWCLIEQGKLTEEYQDKYTIQGATKAGNDVWLIYARIQYGGKDVTVPVPVQLKWAGDTPVITLDKVSIPGLGAYSARVLVYEDTYAGTWSAKDHAGMLHGVIEKAGKEQKQTPEPAKAADEHGWPRRLRPEPT